MRRVRTAVVEMKQLQRDRRARNVRSRDIRMNAALSDERGDGRREKRIMCWHRLRHYGARTVGNQAIE